MKIIKTILVGLPFMVTTILSSQTQSSLLWKIEKPGKKVSYIFLNTNVCTFGDNFKKLESKILPNVEVIAVEQNLNSDENKKYLQNMIGVTDNKQKLKNILSLAEYQKIIAFAKEKAGMTEQMVNMFKPFYVNAFLSSQSNPCAGATTYRLENDLQYYSTKTKKNFIELLNVNDYVKLMDGEPQDYWSSNISYVFDNSDESKIALETKNKLYYAGDLLALKGLFNDHNYFKTKYTQEITQHYSDTLLPKIEKITETKTVLFSIDPGYFTATKNNLFNRLQLEGYKVSLVEL